MLRVRVSPPRESPNWPDASSRARAAAWHRQDIVAFPPHHVTTADASVVTAARYQGMRVMVLERRWLVAEGDLVQLLRRDDRSEPFPGLLRSRGLLSLSLARLGEAFQHQLTSR